jgi:hypothetical protein
MGAYEHEGLRVDVDQGVAFVTLDHPPVNLFDAVLIGSLGQLAGELATTATSALSSSAAPTPSSSSPTRISGSSRRCHATGPTGPSSSSSSTCSWNDGGPSRR